MKKEDVYTCNRCGKTFSGNNDDKNFEPYSCLDYRVYLKGEYGLRRFSFNGKWEDVHLCRQCTREFNYLLGLFGLKTIVENTYIHNPQKLDTGFPE